MTMRRHEIVTQQQWLHARRELLQKEKRMTRMRDELNAERMALPWVRVEKRYEFDGPHGKLTLDDLFRGRSQLFIKHFMMAPGVSHQCVGCSLEVDHVEGLLPHLENHDISYVAVARAPIDEIEVVRERMNWKFLWVSSFNSDFNYDFDVTFRPADVETGNAMYNFKPAPDWAAQATDLSGDSVFYRDQTGAIFRTYSTYGRGGEQSLGIYGILDMMPKGRNETGPNHSLTDWARPHNMYGHGGEVERNGRYHAPACGVPGCG